MAAMIDAPREYFRQLVPPRDALLLELEAEAEREDIPVVGPVVGRLLATLVRISAAANVLELGTATGYSAIWMARAFQRPDARLLTVEHAPEMAQRAGRNVRRAGLDSCIEIRVGSAETVLENLAPPFDIAFLDIEKSAYGSAMIHCERLLQPGGLLVADNVGFKDADDFNRSIFASPHWEPVSLYGYLPFHSPEDDGLCLALRT